MAGRRLLAEAARGDVSTVAALLDEGDDIEQRDPRRDTTPLLNAIIAGHLEVVALLIDRGAELHDALALAVRRPDAAMVRVLLQRGAAVDHVPQESMFGSTSLLDAASLADAETVRILLAAGADPNRVDRRGDNALSRARRHLADEATESAMEVVEALLAAGATEPTPVPFPPSLPWPELDWDPTQLHHATTLPAGADASQVVASYIRALHSWEVEALEDRRRAGDPADPGVARAISDGTDAALTVAHRLTELHVTQQRGRHRRELLLDGPPDLTPEHVLLAISAPSPSRCDLLVRHPNPTEVEHRFEWTFECLRGDGEWRIDAARTRLVGMLPWIPAVL